MSRFAILEQQAAPPTFEGDSQIVGVNMKMPRDQLPAGYVARAENKRFTHGAATRPGTRTPAFANGYPAEIFLGSGVYSDPNGFEMALLCGVSHVIAIRAGTAPISIAIDSTQVPLSGKVEFSQQFDKVLLHRDDPSKPTMVWDGLTASTGFLPIVTEQPEDTDPGIVAIPNAAWSINFLSRAWGPLPDKADSFFASDINNYTVYDRDLHEFRVNTGTADALVGLYPYALSNLIVGKRRSIDMLQQIPGDLGDSFLFAITIGLAPASAPPPGVTVVNTNIGMVARKAVVMLSDRLLFLSDSGGGGIYQIRQGGNTESTLSVDPMPVSDAIEPLIRRINWEYASGAVAQLNGIFAQFLVPIDGCKYNNAALILNTATNTWHGVDFWRATPRIQSGRRQPTDDNPMRADNLINLDYYGVSRLFAINHTESKVHLLYEGFDDQLAVAGTDGRESKTYPIQDLIETRGYNTLGWNAASYRDFRKIEIQLLTNNASVDLTAIVDGENDERLLTARSLRPIRTAYDIWGKSPYVVTNENDDFDAPKRGDYAIFVDDQFVLQDGVPLQRLAPAVLRFAMFTRGRFISYRIENNRGYCAVLAIVQESVGNNRPERKL